MTRGHRGFILILMKTTTAAAPNYSFDGACEAIRTILSAREADALIECALEQMDDVRSAASLAVEFGVDVAMVAGVQS